MIIPIVIFSEFIYWLESQYITSLFHIPAPVIPLMIAAVAAILITNLVSLPAKYAGGLQFSTKWLLRIGIILYGLNFSYALWLRPGAEWILVIGFVTVIIPMVVAYLAGKYLHLDQHSSILVAIGTGVCGISAIVAAQQALKSDEKSAGMALATILVFGTFVLFLYPILEGLFSLNQTVYGIWTGATTLDLPQLVAAALQGGGTSSLTAALWVKSIRIGLLAPAILIISMLLTTQQRSDSGKPIANQGSTFSRMRAAMKAFPLFIVAFFFVILLNTLYSTPKWIDSILATGSGQFIGLNIASLFLTAAIIGICFRVRKDVVGKSGWKILAIGGLAWGIQSLLVFWLANILPIPHV